MSDEVRGSDVRGVEGWLREARPSAGGLVREEVLFEVGRASVAIQGAGARLAAGSLRALTFGGQPSVLVPPGAEVLSDPVRVAIAPFAHVAVSLYLPVATGPATEHIQARQVNYVGAGDRALAAGAQGFGRRTLSGACEKRGHPKEYREPTNGSSLTW